MMLEEMSVYQGIKFKERNMLSNISIESKPLFNNYLNAQQS